MEFINAKELLESCREKEISIAQAMTARECALFETDEESIKEGMRRAYRVMQESCHQPTEQVYKSMGGLIGGEAKNLHAYDACTALCGTFVSRAMCYALAVMERNASMGVIVAAPTAGSAGVLPAGVVALCESENLPEDKALEGLLTAAAIGYLAMRNASVSGAEAGCQAEVGMASAMTAGALTAMLGGSPQQAVDAASICIANVLGLVCDPVAGLVENPCQTRNVMGVMNAIAASQMVLSGIRAFIPLDEMIDSMYRVGKALPFELRETALGGCAATGTACRKCSEIFKEE